MAPPKLGKKKKKIEIEPMWLNCLQIRYDYEEDGINSLEVNDTDSQELLLFNGENVSIAEWKKIRKINLEKLVSKFVLNLATVEIHRFEHDPLSNDFCVHVTGSEDQSNSDIWHQERLFKVTATSFKSFADNPSGWIRKFWNGAPDLSHLKSIKYGKDHEESALIAVSENEEFGDDGPIIRCGFFVSRNYPMIGATPDALQGNEFIIEVKCPIILKDLHPNDFHKLKPEQKKNFFLWRRCGEIMLKKNHPYYFQMQCQMLVTGRKYGYLVV